ncbi:proteasome-associated protein ECM29 homolog [Glossina fuscipes fuscipes]
MVRLVLTAFDLITLDTYDEILDYLRLCLWYSAGAVCAPGDVKYLNNLKRYIISSYEESDNNELHQYVQFVKRSVEAKRCESNLLCLHDLLIAAPELLASSLL